MPPPPNAPSSCSTAAWWSRPCWPPEPGEGRMLRNYLVTALRNLGRNWLYGAISILGLAVAFAAALLIAQFVRNEFSYDHWIPGYQRVYKLTDELHSPGAPVSASDITQSALAGQMRVALPGVTTARLNEDSPPLR